MPLLYANQQQHACTTAPGDARAARPKRSVNALLNRAAAGNVAKLPGGQRLIVVEQEAVADIVDDRGLLENAVTAGAVTAALVGAAIVVLLTLFRDAIRRRTAYV